MSNLDLWYPFLLPAVNILKSLAAAMPWDWNPYQTMSNHITWQKVPLLCILFLLLPFFSIKASLTRPFHILLRFEKFNPQRTVVWIASILFPQALFWCAYPIFIIIISLCSPWFFNVLKSFLRWFHGVLTTIPVFNIIIWTTTSWQNPDPQPHEVEAIEWHQQQQEPGLDTEAVDAIEGDDLL